MKDIVTKILESVAKVSGYDMSPYSDDDNFYKNVGSDAMVDLVLTAESHSELYSSKIEPLIKSLLRKKREDLSYEKLANSSVMKKIATDVNKICKKAGNTSVTNDDLRVFREYYAKYIIDVQLDEYLS